METLIVNKFTIRLAQSSDVGDIDIRSLNRKLRDRIRKAIETRLTTEPHRYGDPLRKTLKGYRKLRIGDYRIVFEVVKHEVWIPGIIHRKKVYDHIIKRT
jgi:mRNA interferase RelE/StbE